MTEEKEIETEQEAVSYIMEHITDLKKRTKSLEESLKAYKEAEKPEKKETAKIYTATCDGCKRSLTEEEIHGEGCPNCSGSTYR